MQKSVVFHDGQLHDGDTPLIAAADQAIVMGLGVFETLVAHGGRLFAFDRHLDRLEMSASVMGLPTPDREAIAEDMGKALVESGFHKTEKSRIRLTLTAGIGDRRFAEDGPEPQLFFEISPAPAFKEFASLVTVPFVRNERGALTGAKTISYGENAVAFKVAREAGADEAIFGNTRNLLCEGTVSNIFVYIDGKWITPPLTSGCLAGVTRALVLELGHEIEEIDFEMSRLGTIDGAFLTSTLRGLQAVGEIDGRKLPRQEPPGFPEMKSAFQELADPKG